MGSSSRSFLHPGGESFCLLAVSLGNERMSLSSKLTASQQRHEPQRHQQSPDHEELIALGNGNKGICKGSRFPSAGSSFGSFWPYLQNSNLHYNLEPNVMEILMVKLKFCFQWKMKQFAVLSFQLAGVPLSMQMS